MARSLWVPFLGAVILAALWATGTSAQTPLITDVRSGDRAVFLTFSKTPGDTMTREERARIPERTFAGYRVWRRLATEGGTFELLREYSLLDSTWMFSGEARLFADPDSILVRRNPAPDEDEDLIVTGPVNGFRYNYSVTWFEASLDTTVIPPQPEIFPASVADIEASAWPAVVAPGEVARQATPLLAEVRVVPNPYDPSAAFGKQVFPGAPRIQFVNLPSPAQVDVYTVAGDIVVTLRNESTTDSIDWDLTNGRGEAISSGLYVFRVAVPSGETTVGRFVIVR